MSNQPIDEISCCNCSECQAYILALVKRIEALEEAVRAGQPSYLDQQADRLGPDDLARIRVREQEHEEAYYRYGYEE